MTKNKGGRPTKYDPKYHPRLVYSLSLLGATDSEIAQAFEITESTLNLWKLKHPRFSESIKKGKVTADADIAKSLYHRAKGYSHPEDKIFNNSGEALIVPTTKHYPPDTAAAFIWLKNRRGKDWKDKKEIELSPLEGLTDAQLDERIEYLLHQLGRSLPAPNPDVIEGEVEESD